MSKLRAWLQLFRVPNLLTVPGDPLAGFLIASGGHLDARAMTPVIAALCLYMAGLVWNDLADHKEDALERPNRPLPSGAISRGAAVLVSGNLVIFGVGICFASENFAVAIMAVGTLLSVILYNFFAKKIPVIGALVMGSCRFMSVLIGAAAGKGIDADLFASGQKLEPLSLPASTLFKVTAVTMEQGRFLIAVFCAAAIGLFIAAVTNLARFETRREAPKVARLLPVGALLLGYLIVKQFSHILFFDAAPTLWVGAIFASTGVAMQLMRVPMPPLPPRIGSFIRILPILQAALCVLPSVGGTIAKTRDSLICAFVLLAFVPLHAKIAKKFYAS